MMEKVRLVPGQEARWRNVPSFTNSVFSSSYLSRIDETRVDFPRLFAALLAINFLPAVALWCYDAIRDWLRRHKRKVVMVACMARTPGSAKADRYPGPRRGIASAMASPRGISIASTSLVNKSCLSRAAWNRAECSTCFRSQLRPNRYVKVNLFDDNRCCILQALDHREKCSP